ncbi:hypothetical protein CDAR_384851 [Caerostris darwini]|uniref:Uncharacterized protein n=1 Tax=Caerostris darwini TaxID=1538125 RepID=A0AAV4WAW1_9ARAC|nr:hypothetical protein CDAR_384851 [Caerostris darwini]
MLHLAKYKPKSTFPKQHGRRMNENAHNDECSQTLINSLRTTASQLAFNKDFAICIRKHSFQSRIFRPVCLSQCYKALKSPTARDPNRQSHHSSQNVKLGRSFYESSKGIRRR